MTRSFLEHLRQGSYIFYARHAEATAGEDSTFMNIQDCSTQRNLSERGRNQARTYGEIFARSNIPVTLFIFSSPLCRTIETAQLAFGPNNVQVDPFWLNFYQLSGQLHPTKQANILNTLHLVLETPPPAGINKVIIAHSFPPGVGLGRMPNMGTIVVRPRGQGRGYEVVGQLTLDHFEGLLDE
ncbi:histidine phosphatase family protein [Desertibacillus haloalkaliphilus]|nr:histidine phosphatase family protein [Desertibacillus haloalkaliphilus]